MASLTATTDVSPTERVPLSASVTGDHGRLRVKLRGPLDGVSVRQVEDMIDWLADEVSQDITIDLREVRANTGASLAELSAAARHLNSLGGHLHLER